MCHMRRRILLILRPDLAAGNSNALDSCVKSSHAVSDAMPAAATTAAQILKSAL